jgi:hypothetical protein
MRLAVVVLLSALAGCGGGKSSTSSGSVTEQVASKTASITNGVVTPHKLPVDKNTDTVQWSTNDAQGYAIAFMNQGWPFQEPPQLILVKANGKSDIFHLLSTVDSGPYAYSVYSAGLANPGGTFPPGKLTDPTAGPSDPPNMDVGP